MSTTTLERASWLRCPQQPSVDKSAARELRQMRWRKPARPIVDL
jgi:hypothetical protein